MKIRISILIAICTLCFACRKHVEPRHIAGYITASSDTEITLSVPDSIGQGFVFAIDENTTLDEGVRFEGNIAEVEYMPSTEEGELPLALDITTDPTYPNMLGRWHTDKDEKLQIDIVLQSHGKILQMAPTEILQFTHWQLTGVEDEITLHGTLSLPPQLQEKKKSKESNDELESAQSRRTMNFCATARLADDDEGSTEQHKVLIITTDKGRKSKLYPAGE